MSLKEWFSIVREAEEPPAYRSSVDPASEPQILIAFFVLPIFGSQ